LFAAIVFAFNAFSTRLFGETEFWLSLVKVSAIVALIILGGAALLRLHPLKASADPPLR
jgi:S-methylmethionine transporter